MRKWMDGEMNSAKDKRMKDGWIKNGQMKDGRMDG